MIGTAGHYLTLVILKEMAGTGLLTATTVGFAVGAVINYILNYHVTFRSSRKHISALPRFMLIAIAGMFLNGLVVSVLASNSNFHYLMIQVVATLLVLVWNFAANRLWTFVES